MIQRDEQRTVGGQGTISSTEVPSSMISSKTIRVALLSDSALFRSGLRRLLSSDRSLLVVGEITAPPIREILRNSVPQILLVDAQTRGALEICRELRLNGVRPWVILAGARRPEGGGVDPPKTGVSGSVPPSAR